MRRGTDLQLLHLGGPDAGPSQLANQRPADDGVDSWGTTTRKVNTGRSHSTVSGALSGALSQERSQEHCLALSQEHCLRSTVSAALSHEHSQRNPCHAETLCPGRWQQPSVSLRDGAVHDFVNTAVLPSRGVSFWLPSLVGLVGVRTCDAVEGRGADGGGPVLQASERGL